MNAERWRRIENLFDLYVGLPAKSREEFLLSQTSSDEDLAAEIRQLAEAHFSTNTVFDAASLGALLTGARIGPYEVDRLLGSGGMGSVYLGHRADRQYEKQVAIKLIARGFADGQILRRFRRERQILAALEHPNIARLLDGGMAEFGQPYIVMEYTDGRNAIAYCREEKLSSGQRLELWLKVASAVSYAHRNLIVHRDIKPGNILVGADGEPKLVDFGIAKLLGEEIPSDDTIRASYFTPSYASPEQLRGEPVNTATDVFSLGILLCTLFTGEHPFYGSEQPSVEAARAALEADPRLPATLPPDLAAVISMAVRKEPHRRYLSVEQFAEDVRRFRSGLPVAARPDTWRYRWAKFVVRHRAAAAAGTIFVLALAATTGVAVYQAHIARRQTQKAETTARFLTGIFLGGPEFSWDPSLVVKGENLRFVDLLDHNVSRIGPLLKSEPETEADLRVAFSNLYYKLGRLKDAAGNARRSLDLCLQLYGSSGPKTLTSRLVWGNALMGTAQFAEAEREFNAVTQARIAVNPAVLVPAYGGLSAAQYRQGRLAEARSSALKVLDVGVRAWGPLDPRIGPAVQLLGVIHTDEGNLPEAIRYYQQAIEMMSKPPILDLYFPLVNLANIYRFQGQHRESEALAQRAYYLMTQSVGSDHYSLITAMALLASAKVNLGEPGAEELIRRGVAIQARSLPPGHFERAVGLTMLGYVLMKEGKPAQALPPLREALVIRRDKLLPLHYRIAETAGYLGEALAALHQLAEARPLLDESHKTFLKLYGRDHPLTRSAAKRLRDTSR